MQPEEIKVFIGERKPASSEDAGRLADDYLLASKLSEGDRRKRQDEKFEKRCERCGIWGRCGILGHLVKDFRVKLRKSGEQMDHFARAKKDLRDVE